MGDKLADAEIQTNPSRVDVEEIRKKYLAERNKRLRGDGIEQFEALDGKFAHFAEDPQSDPGFSREPMTGETDALVIGAGFGGMLSGIRMKQAGAKSVRFIDDGMDFGGTWYWNRYPGCACDVESYIYLPMLEELGYIPKEKYSHAPEIYELAKNMAQKFELYEHACFQTRVTEMRWNDNQKLWVVKTNRNDVFKARFVTSSTGPLSKPKVANMPGIGDFKGHIFHTSRWDYDYTGGDHTGNMSNLNDKRVAIIGTGSTSIQLVPYLARDAKQLYVVQRTPSLVEFRDNKPTDPKWAENLKPGWHTKRKMNFLENIAGIADEDMVNDGWTHLARQAGALVPTAPPEGFVFTDEMMLNLEKTDYEAMQNVHSRIDSIVKNQATADALKPHFRINCKRPTFSDEYLQTFNHSNVELVDTCGRGVSRITENGIVCGDKEIEVDCIIMASGFEVGTDYATRTGFEVYGKGDVSLTEKWKDGYKTLYGFMIRGFPNFFPIGLFQVGVAANYMQTLEELGRLTGHIVERCLNNNARCFDVTPEAETMWQEKFQSRLAGEEFLAACTPGYYNNEGGDDFFKFGLFAGSYGGGPFEYFDIVEAWRQDAKAPGLKFEA